MVVAGERRVDRFRKRRRGAGVAPPLTRNGVRTRTGSPTTRIRASLTEAIREIGRLGQYWPSRKTTYDKVPGHTPHKIFLKQA